METPCLKQLIEAYKKYKTTILGVQEVSDEMVNRYGIIQGKDIDDKISLVTDLVEKPSIEEKPSNTAILGRYIMSLFWISFFKIANRPRRPEIRGFQTFDNDRRLLGTFLFYLSN